MLYTFHMHTHCGLPISVYSTVEPLNKGLLGSWALVLHSVEPPNKGHFESVAFVLYSEVVLWWEVQIFL